eukprot:scaffold3181_cov389-Prasinococcus_capsulatus_cf.AAC.7
MLSGLPVAQVAALVALVEVVVGPASLVAVVVAGSSPEGASRGGPGRSERTRKVLPRLVVCKALPSLGGPLALPSWHGGSVHHPLTQLAGAGSPTSLEGS